MADRQTIVFVPGLLCTAALWAAQIDALQDQADIIVADITRHDSLAALAADVLAEAPDRFALAGLSMGGYVALEMMRRAPERVSRLALLDTNARADDPAATERRRAAMDKARGGDFDGVLEDLIPLLFHPDAVAEGTLAATFRDMGRAVGPDAFGRQMTAIMGRPDSRPDLPAIAVPTLVLCGRQDALSPPDWHREMADAIGGAELVILEDCGHMAPMEKPQETTAALRRWLAA